MSAPYSSKAVANAILRIAKENGCNDMCLRKLQKLIYYANAWHLAFFDIPLIKEEVEAWEFGPVIHDIYFEFKEFGLTHITSQATELMYEDDNLELITPTVPLEDINANDILNEVFQKYGKLTATQLLNLVHSEGEPWKIVADKYHNELSRRIEIPSELIKSCFNKRLQA